MARANRLSLVVALLGGLGAAPLHAADAPRVRELRTQKVGDTTYFQVRFETPKDLEAATPPADGAPARPDLVRQPRLVPQDDQTRAVYRRFEMPVAAPAPAPGAKPAPAPPAQAPVEGLEFVGQVRGSGPAKLLLLYPVADNKPVPEKKKGPDKEPRTSREPAWAEVPVTLDFTTAKPVAVPEQAKQRKPAAPPSGDDLEGLWAVGQAGQFAVLEALAPDFGFYGFAREATGRKYRVAAPQMQRAAPAPAPDFLDRQLYETTTGAAAITESLQQQRLLNPNARDTGERKLAVATLPGIDIAEHPWEQMMGDKRPAAEPLARFVPHDNYYLHFRGVAKLLELGDLLDQWGTTLVRAYEVNSRDLRLRQRYEKQLCIKSTTLGRLLGPTVIDDLAITGSDLYLREGSDVTILFRVRNKELFLAAVEPFLRDTKKEYGGRLNEAKEDYHGVAIESYATPFREVSLHRATLDDVVIYSNSPVAVRRVLDARQGRRKALADSPDFRYMRTAFRADDPQEDGFLFLSDPFIRQLVGPASKINEKRRLEALTSLAMVTNGVLFTAWENARLPGDQKALLHASGLKQEEIYAPGGKDVAWDAGQRLAVSDVYNTLHFATPLVELPIDRVTDAEAQGYQRFRAEYLGLWRQYFDPIGMRIALTPERVKVETYILPLVQSSAYNDLREQVGGATTTLDPAAISPKTLVQLKTHLNPKGMRNELISLLSVLDGKISFDFLGDWFLVRLDDSPVLAKLAELLLREEDDPSFDPREGLDLLFQVPLTVAVEVRQPLVLAGLLGSVRSSVLAALPGAVTWGALEPAYKGVSIVRIQAAPEGQVAKLLDELGDGKEAKDKKPFSPALYYAMIDGAFYLSLTEDALKSQIDAAVARREGKEPAKKRELIPIHSSLYVAPGAMAQAGDVLGMLLEREVHERALGNAPILYALYRTGLVGEKATEAEVQAAALKYLGFVPVSPDGAAYAYDARDDEVVNQRHGSPRRPRQHLTMAKTSPLGQLLGQLQSLRADLRFREDGVHTVLTLERKAK